MPRRQLSCVRPCAESIQQEIHALQMRQDELYAALHAVWAETSEGPTTGRPEPILRTIPVPASLAEDGPSLIRSAREAAGLCKPAQGRTLPELLAPLNREQLVELLGQLVLQEPELIGKIKAIIVPAQA